MKKGKCDAIEKKLRDLERKRKQQCRIEQELLEKQEMLKKQNINLVRKSIDLSDVKRELEDKNFDLELTRADLEKTLEALKESEERYRQLVEHSMTGIYLTQDHILEFANRTLTGIFGYTGVDEILGKHVKQLVAEESWETVNREVALRESGQKDISHYEFKVKKKDGTLADVEVLGSSITYRGKPAVLGTMIDITDRKRMEAERQKLEEQLHQSQKMEAIGTLAGGIAHDFNNILGVISGYTELSIDDLDEGIDPRENLEQVMISARRAKELVRQILDFSRKSIRERKPTDTAKVLKESLKLLRSSLPSTIAISSKIKKGVKPVLANAVQLHQVIMNLCTNAAHAMKDHGGRLDVELRGFTVGLEDKPSYKRIGPGEYVRLTVSDSGHGMERTVLDRIFDPYFTTKKAGQGTGMGLAVTHGIVKSYRGEISVYSEPGIGTTFHIYLPVVNENNGKKTESEKNGPLPRGNERILLVDDEKELVLLTERMLKKLGYTVTTETNPVEALHRFRQNPGAFDLVITDQTMPDMTGERLAGEILSIKPGFPIILYTGFSENVNEKNYRAMGIGAFLMKPFLKKDIAPLIREVLNK